MLKATPKKIFKYSEKTLRPNIKFEVGPQEKKTKTPLRQA